MVTAAILSFIAEELRPLQQRNVEIEKKQDILRSVGRATDTDKLKDKNTYIDEEFLTYINNSLVINHKGEIVEDRDAFEITKNLKAELAKPIEQRGLPIFMYTKQEDDIKYIIPMLGRGLWGQIWGYIALDDDFSTVYGAVFDHAKETPGLGAEINTDWFQEKFSGKHIFDNTGKFVSLEVVKGGAAPGNIHGVDAISGGTITSKGLEEMIYDCLKPYEPYFKKHMKSNSDE
jgi:Na+-transporting NADH:ubiquinone oxidoreductase subunit C